jgi:hypothetical protein
MEPHMSLMAWMGKEELVEADWDGYKAACPTEVEKLAAGDGCVVARHSRGRQEGPQMQVKKKRWKGQKNCCHNSGCFRMLFNCHHPP